MPRRNNFDTKLLQNAIDESVGIFLQKLVDDGLDVRDATASCEHLSPDSNEVEQQDTHQAGEPNPVTGDSEPMLSFRWQICLEGKMRETLVQRRYRDVMRSGIPLPNLFVLALKCEKLPKVAQQSASIFANDYGARDPRCVFLGLPRAVDVVMSPNVCQVGAIYTTRKDDDQVEYMLCASIQGDDWLCLPGPVESDNVTDENLFRVDRLIAIDVTIFFCGPGCERPHKRPRTDGSETSRLASLTTKCPHDLEKLVALAHWKAETIRADQSHREIIIAAGASQYEADPWKWQHAATRKRKHLEIAFLWSWQTKDGLQYQFVQASTKQAQSMTSIRMPDATNTDSLMECLMLAAKAHEQNHHTPCTYLGLEVAPDMFEPDPSKWSVRHVPNGIKLNAEVVYEWTHVVSDGAPFRTRSRVDRIVKDASRFLHSPLQSDAPSGLTFSLEFVDAVAKLVHEGVHFKGIVYEADRPSIVRQLPSGGLDVQDEPLFWTLPDGRCVCKSLREVAALLPNELAPKDSHEEYLEVAKRLGYHALGKPNDENAFEDWRVSPGTLAERTWQHLSWLRPLDETCSCWWVANADEMDGETPLKLICRSLQGRAQLN